MVYLLSAFCGIIVLIHLVAAFFPRGRIWGINHWSSFSPWISLLLGVFVLLFFVPSMNEQARKSISYLFSPVIRFLNGIGAPGQSRKYLWYGALSLLFLIPFWLLRDRTHLLGDGAQIVSYLNSGELTIKWAEPLEIFLHLKAFDLAHRLWQMDSATLYAILSCLAGVLFVFLVLLFADFCGRGGKEKVFIFLILLSMGSTQLFFGYVEHYSFLYVFIFGFILSSLGYLEGKVSWFVPLAAFVLASLSHVSSVYLLPPLLFVFAARDEDRGWFSQRKIMILGGGLIFVVLILVTYMKFSWTVPPMFVPLWQDRYSAPGYLLFSLPHILDFLNQQLLLGPVGLSMMLAPFICGKTKLFFKDKIFQFLLLLILFQLLFNFVTDPGLGASRDWDLFSAVGLGYTILGLFLFIRLLKSKAAFSYLSMILVVSSLYSVVPWLVLNSNEQKSITRFQHLLELEGKRSTNGHFILMRYFEEHEMKQEAEKQNELYKLAFPDLVLAQTGATLLEKGELESAEEKLLQAEKLAPKVAQIHNDLGYIYIRFNRLEKAEIELKKAIKLKSFWSAPYVNLADVYLLRQEYNLALDVYKKAIALKDEYPQIYSNAALIYYMRGELKKAEEHYTKALRIYPQFADAYAGLGDIYNARGLSQEAIQMYKIAVDLNPDKPVVRYQLGITYLSVNAKQKAKKELELYLKLSPQGKDAEKAQEILEKLK